jgi:hypothetical protein
VIRRRGMIRRRGVSRRRGVASRAGVGMRSSRRSIRRRSMTGRRGVTRRRSVTCCVRVGRRVRVTRRRRVAWRGRVRRRRSVRCRCARFVLGASEGRNHHHERDPNRFPQGTSIHFEIHRNTPEFSISSDCQSELQTHNRGDCSGGFPDPGAEGPLGGSIRHI